MFAWNGKYQKLGMVNIWPRPIQKPHPPVWVPGTGSLRSSMGPASATARSFPSIGRAK